MNTGEKVIISVVALLGIAAAGYGLYKVVKPDPVVINDANNYTPGDYSTQDSLFSGMMAIFGQSQQQSK